MLHPAESVVTRGMETGPAVPAGELEALRNVVDGMRRKTLQLIDELRTYADNVFGGLPPAPQTGANNLKASPNGGLQETRQMIVDLDGEIDRLGEQIRRFGRL